MPANSNGRSTAKASTDPDWLRWVKRLQAIAQDGLTYTRDEYDIGRYEQLRALAAEILAAHSTGDLAEASALLDLQFGPATPKVDVRAAVFRDEKILLIKEPEDGAWSLPGGWADVGETPAETVAREVYEESGYQVRATRLLAVYDRDHQGHTPIPYHVYKLCFLCEILAHDATYPVEADGVEFFSESELPELSASRVTPAQIEAFFHQSRHPDHPADFD